MTRKILTGMAIISSLFLLGSCGVKEEINDDNLVVTLDTSPSNTTDKNIEIHLKKGETIQEALNKDEALKDEISKATSLDEELSLDGWYVSSETALNLDRGQGDKNIFSFSTPVEQSVTLYGGYIYPEFNKEVKDYISYYLGVYEEDGYSPLPIVRTSTYISAPEIDASSDNNSLSINDVSKASYDYYLNSLTSSYGFNKNGDVFTDPLDVYSLKVNYDEEATTLTLTYAFLDEENKFPAKFVSSQFYALDTKSLLNDDLFMLAENVLPEGQKKFVTRIESSSSSIPSRVKDVYYVPKSTSETPVDDFYEWVSTLSVMTLNKETDSSTGESVITGAADESSSTYLTVSLVDDPTLEELAKGVTKGMVKAQFVDYSSSSFNEEYFKDAFNSYLGVNLDDGEYSFPTGIKGYGAPLVGTLGGKTVVGYSGIGITAEDLQSFFESMKEKDWNGSKSEGSSFTQFQLTSKLSEFGMVINYYPAKENSYSSFVNVFFYHQDSVTQDFEKWFAASNVGGGEVSGIPLFESDGSYSSGNMTSSGTEVGNAHYLSGTQVKSEYVSAYEAELVKEGWVKDEETSKEASYPVYKSADGFYSLNVIYSLQNETLGIQVIYNGSGTAKDIDGVIKNIGPRLGIDSSFEIPGLGDLINGKEVITEQFYNLTDNRAYVTVPLTSEDEVTKAKESLNSAIEAKSNWKKVGTVGSSGIPAYQEENTGIIAFALDSTVTNADGTKSYSVSLILYRDI